jgi:hypothetical protein
MPGREVGTRLGFREWKLMANWSKNSNAPNKIDRMTFSYVVGWRYACT